MSRANYRQIIEQLGLEPHLEGGYFKRSYTHSLDYQAAGGTRPLMSCIYYLLTQDSPIGHWHQNQSDIMHFHHQGGVIRYWLLSPEGALTSRLLGCDDSHAGEWQLCVPGGYWKASELLTGDYALISEAVSPGFDFADHKLATNDDIKGLGGDVPQHWQSIAAFIK